MVDKFFEQVTEELARKPEQKFDEKPEAPAVPVSPTPGGNATTGDDVSTVLVSSAPDGGDVSVDGAFVGNAPATLRLKPGKHTITVAETGYKAWSRDLTTISGSEVKLNATLEKK